MENAAIGMVRNMKGYEKFEGDAFHVSNQLLDVHDTLCVKGNVPTMAFILALEQTAYSLGTSMMGKDKTIIILKDMIGVIECDGK